MKSKLLFPAIVLAILMFVSCKKKVEKPEYIANSTYKKSPLSFKKNTYWVYQYYKIDSTGLETKLNDIDSMWIAGDTMIKGNKYLIFEGDIRFYTVGVPRVYLRDSSGTIVSSEGKIEFSYKDMLNPIQEQTYVNGQDTMYKTELICFPKSSKKTPLGKFTTINAQTNYTSTLFTHWNGKTYNTQKHFSMTIGEISNSFFFAGYPQEYFERRLIRYSIK